MKPYKREFIKFALANDVLNFGTFTLKSGRISPYFFNTGMFKDGNSFLKLSQFYADMIHDNFEPHTYDALFGPAYKGILLATAAGIGLATKYQMNIPVSFNRKEIEDHSQPNNIIGSSLSNKKIILVDDVIASGTMIRESANIIKAKGGHLVGIAITLDRQERGLTTEYSAIQELEQELHVKIANIITLDDLIEYLQNQDLRKHPEIASHLQSTSAYRTKYSIKK